MACSSCGGNKPSKPVVKITSIKPISIKDVVIKK